MIVRAFASVAVVAVLGAGACGPPQNAAPCAGDQDCTLEGGGRCLPAPTGANACAYPDPGCPSGYQWSDLAGGVAGQCVGDSIDAGVDATDAADVIDAEIDAGPSNPIVTNYQMADLVIGQPSFTAPTMDRGFTANSVGGDGLAANAAGIWIADANHNRVVQFAPLPTTGDPSASGIVGRPSLTDSGSTGTPSSGNLGTTLYGVAAGGSVLAVADAARHRVLIWNPAPTTPGASANRVIGQSDFAGASSGTGASQLRTPGCVWTDGTRLVVCDTFNHRVLIWSTFPTTDGQAADLVLGQTGFGAAVDPSVPSATNLSRPFGALVAGSRLYIADEGFNRVLVWDTFPVSNNEPADIVLGQATFTESRDVAADAVYMNSPRGLAVYRDALLVSDTGNGRVMIFQPVPITSGSAAALVLGQPDLFTGNPPPTLPTQRDFRGLGDIAVVGNRLYVGDTFARRVLRFTLL